MTIFTDCSYSGAWVRELTYFLDGAGVQPCGHSARAENIIMTVFASCRSHQIPHSLLYSARGRGNDKETGELGVKINGYEVAQGQHISWINNADITCKEGASYADPCLMASDFTWHKKRVNGRIKLVRGTNGGRQGWWYVVLHDDEELQEQYYAKKRNGTLRAADLADYSTVFKSGRGKDPPEEVKRAVSRRKDVTKHTY